MSDHFIELLSPNKMMLRMNTKSIILNVSVSLELTKENTRRLFYDCDRYKYPHSLS